MSSPILVTGATGRHGNTGEHLVGRLLAAGRSVRVLARGHNPRTQHLAVLGAEIVIGDLGDRRSLVPALRDVDLVYFVYPINAGIVSAAANYAAAVRKVGRHPRTVVMSMGPAHPEHPSALGRAQWLAEQVLDWAGLDLTVLRVAALFHENLAVLHARTIRDEQVIRNCFGADPVPWIGARDVADLAATALLHPEGLGVGPVHHLAGAEDLSHLDIADALTELLDIPIEFADITEAQWRDDLITLANSDTTGALNTAMAQHISAVASQIARGGGPAMSSDPDRLHRLIGHAPVTMREFLATNIEDFRSVRLVR
ncbi:NmrA family transcriptional regulator [Mycolicibacterium madagascariense]|uniref:NmrA family transcriptional regulator n=1 Tax=Mycolicibacterium madagascariense TaxID=212765 RepID=A0A7I7XCM3_9MYCO|nr:NAD(P)H-binding protein [Mycolicibacterium madagascariense]MCV7014943.1 NAD(P)H-binding protein [Mycolicibacterium madagascariense]BBZ26653.1 NmrA family transcriptional regulator [Mycolicibacterium madagascariense]